MNSRERFIATMTFEQIDHPYMGEFGYWISAIRRWYQEGLTCNNPLPDNLDDDATFSGEILGVDWRNKLYASDVNKAMKFDEPLFRIPVNNMYSPQFETDIIEDKPQWYKMRSPDGEVVQVSKINGSRHYIEFPVKERKDYMEIRERRLKPDLKNRLFPDWPMVREKLKKRTFPLMYGGNMGFFNQPRRLVGVDRLCMMFYDDPELVRLMIDDTVNLLIGIYEPLLKDVGGDCAMISEDMCYKSGCFVSPDMFREFMLPAYQKLTDFYRSHGINIIYIDSDGDVMDLIPLLIEGGVNGLHPFEATGRNDIVKVREQFPKFAIMGGIDKKEISKGKAAIDAELQKSVAPIAKYGGFVPFIDHTVPPTVSWEDFKYYRKRLAEIVTQK
jgi:uroporphyrinogen-III decarboxylase